MRDVWLCQFDALVTKNVQTFKMRKMLVLVLVLLPVVGPLFFGWLNYEIFYREQGKPSEEDVELLGAKDCMMFDMDEVPRAVHLSGGGKVRLRGKLYASKDLCMVASCLFSRGLERYFLQGSRVFGSE